MRALRLGSIRGIDVRIELSWVIIALLITASMTTRAAILYDIPGIAALGLGLGAALVFFASLLAHEISHALMAQALGVPVGGITLFLFGGVTETKQESERPRDEFFITIVGPLTSVAVAVVLWAVSTLIGPSGDPVPGMIGYLAWVNLFLAVFNLFPGYPLDGGRVLRAAVWAVTGDRGRATKVAAAGGQVLGWVFIGFGLLAFFGGGFGGLWLALIGWFLLQSARMSAAAEETERLLRGVRAYQVMTPNPVSLPANVTLDRAIDHWFLRLAHGAYPVEWEGRTIGLVTLDRVRSVPRERRPTTYVGDVMVPLDEVPTVPPTSPMSEVLRVLGDESSRVLVLDGGRVVGIITPRDVARWVRRAEELGFSPGAPATSAERG